jgi:hypothetical protein
MAMNGSTPKTVRSIWIVSDFSDDLQVVRLDAKRITAPPVILWPEIVMHADVPQVVRELLVSRLG